MEVKPLNTGVEAKTINDKESMSYDLGIICIPNKLAAMIMLLSCFQEVPGLYHRRLKVTATSLHIFMIHYFLVILSFSAVQSDN
jgi:hypothetical protein